MDQITKQLEAPVSQWKAFVLCPSRAAVSSGGRGVRKLVNDEAF